MKPSLCLAALSAGLAFSQFSACATAAAPATGLRATRHWNHMPVRVYFQGGGTSSPDRIFSAENGFLEWTTASHGALQYTLVRKAEDADVVVRFVSSMAADRGVARVGETETESAGPVLHRATMRLTTDTADLSQLTEEAAHEWGHALGIVDHSSDPHDLMYPTTIRVYDESTGEFRPTPARTVSADDLRALEAVYGAAFKAVFSRP